MPRCDLCFKEKSPLQQPLPKMPCHVCKGCFYEIDRIIGFLMHYGVTLLTQGELPFKPPKPPRKPKPKSEGTEEGKSGRIPKS